MGQRRLGDVIGEIPDWKPHERPAIPGTPSTPDLPPRTRFYYGLAALLLGLTGGFGTALVGVNLSAMQGELGLEPVQGTWLSCIYVMFNVSMNLLLIKYRQQFGLTSFTKVFMLIYALAAVGHLLSDTYAGALAMRAVSGVAGAALGALAVMYMAQALPARFRLQTIILGIGASQLAMPLAWIISPSLLDYGSWQSLYALEAGFAVASLAAVYAFPLPPGIRVHAFERKDFISFGLLAPGFALLVAVVAQGRNHWWFDTAWLGWALAAAVALLGAGLAFEHRRKNPLLDTHWLFSLGFMNFAFSMLLVRMLLSEQPFGSTGLLMTLGFGAEQMRELYGVVLVATLAGVLVSAFSLLISTRLIVVQLLLSLALIAVGAFMDAHATAATHPINLYFSQALLSFSGAMFMGAAVIIGIGHLMARGLQSVVTFAVMFGVTQILGGQLGAAILSTFQAVRVQHHLSYLSEGVAIADAQSAAAVQEYGGVAGVAQLANQQAGILAFNDVFLLIGSFAVLQLLINVADMIWQAVKRRNAPQPQPAGDNAAAAAPI
ncbi:MFS transporter [Brenneria tiliae]|uniref:MFS transporter n=1 Tax=Brenneria tiliae TaxID=2914984 RepID=A0ABT0MYV2_9GAMM|nr:MFS transporter [Brenneria tiliae]MCL2894752.1 MFS transporter [Brenneria tiliae]